MQTSIKTGFAQIFSCCPKKLSYSKFGGAPVPLARPARTPMFLSLNGKTRKTRISSLGRKNNILIKRKECITTFGELIKYWIWGLLTFKI